MTNPALLGEADLSTLIDSAQVDFGQQSQDYAQHRPGFPDAFYERLVRLSLFTGGEARVLDLGTGPGIVALRLLQLFDEDVIAHVVGVDISENQVLAARARAKELGLEHRSSFHTAPAVATGQPDCSFDVVIAGQCWPWFERDAAIAEVRRVLKRGGRLVVAQNCYLPKQSALARDTEALVVKFNPEWKMAGFDGLYPDQVDQLVVGGGFPLVEQFSFDHAQPFTAASWRGRIRTCNGVGSGTLSAEEIDAFDKELAEMIRSAEEIGKYGRDLLYVWHRVWSVVVEKQQ